MSHEHPSTPRSDAFPRLAIIGMGCLFPKADNVGAFWANIRDGVDGITEVPRTHWRPEDYFNSDPKTPDHTYGQRGGFLDPYPFNPMAFGMAPSTLEGTDTSQLLGMVAAQQAMNDAGYGAGREFNRDRVSVILGVTGALELVIPLGARLGHPVWRKAMKEAGVSDELLEDAVQRIGEHYVPWQEASFPGLLGNVVAGRISKYLDLGGTNCVVDAACASSLSAIHLASMELSTGHADMVVTGGVDTFNDIFMYMCFSKTPALSPTGDAKPFDSQSDGTILGEGIGIVVLKRLEDAERDNDRIYAIIRGIGSSSDGKGDAIYAPNAAGQQKALLSTYDISDVTPESIELLEAHGTGTKVGDAVEARALRAVYSNTSRQGAWCALGSVKSQIGHTKAAAGAAGLIKAALALHNKVLPPTIKVKQPTADVAPGASPFYVNTEKRPWVSSADHPRRAAVSAFGFGGSNFHAVLEEHAPAKAAPDWDGNTQIVALSAGSKSELSAYLKALPIGRPWAAWREAGQRSRALFSGTHEHRLVLVIERDTDAGKLIESAQAMLIKQESAWSLPDGAWYTSGAADGVLAMIFPGQGAQYVNMLRDLVCTFPEALEVVQHADDALNLNPRLSDRIFPHPAFDDATRKTQEESLRATDIAQPALGAVSLAAARVLARFGVAPAAVAGHSYGEWTALAVAGCLGEHDFLRLSRLRGTLMAEGEGDRGTMAAIQASADAVTPLLPEDGSVIIANKNAPGQTVVSGGTVAVDEFLERCKARKLRAVKLPVSGAFHSALVADAAAPLRDALDGVAWNPPHVPVFANTTASAYPEGVDDARAQLAMQLARPVEFIGEIRAMHASGVRTFLEVGPGARLSGLIDRILDGEAYRTAAIDGSNGKRSGVTDLARCLGQLAALGHAVTLAPWDEGFVAAPADDGKAKFIVPICGANHRTARPSRPPRPAMTVKARAAAAPQSQVAATAPAQAMAPGLQSALSLMQQNLAALQQLQQQTAQLHKQYLEGQDAAAQTLQNLMAQQQQLFGLGAPAISPAPVAPVVAPAPVAPAAPVAAAAPAPIAPVAPAPTQASPVASILLNIIAEKTGYPQTMLELGMTLDGDLGIDSIKRVEILSALQEALPDLPAIEADEIGTLRTLGDIVEHLAPAASATSAPARPVASPASPVMDVLLAIVAEKTGYPQEMLSPGMSLDADLGIDSIKRVEILSALQDRLPDLPTIEADELGAIRTLADIAERLGAATPSQSAPKAPSEVAPILLRIVAEKTGYPESMLDLGMSLDADLGIDSIKRVEILSALQDALPDLPSIEADQLGALRTLGDIVRELEIAVPAHAPATVTPSNAVAETLLAIVAEKTGYPVEMLSPDMSLDSDLGIDSIKRVEILSALQDALPHLPAIEAEDLNAVRSLQDIVALLNAQAPQARVAPRPAVEAREEVPAPAHIDRSVLKTVRLNGLDAAAAPLLSPESTIWVLDDGGELSRSVVAKLLSQEFRAELVTLDESLNAEIPESLAGLILIAPQTGADAGFLERAFLLTQRAGAVLNHAAAGGRAMLVTVARMDGHFGLSGYAIDHPLDGGLNGLAKTAGHEWPKVRCKAFDVSSACDAGIADSIVAEMLYGSEQEVGFTHDAWVALRLELEALESASSISPFAPGDVVIVSGGARGVTAEVSVALAAAFQCALCLLGRSDAPAEEPRWLAGIADEKGVKQAIVAQSAAKLSPKKLESEYQKIKTSREIRHTLARIEGRGARAIYRAVDVRDDTAVAQVVDSVRAEYGPIRGVIHGAGVLADRLIADKTVEQFRMVYETKVHGLHALLDATRGDDLSALVMFSSSTARFGRKGQVDYAVANEILNKTAHAEAQRRPHCRVVSMNWGPWDGGMVTPALKKLFDAEGIGVIDLEAGANHLVRELCAPREAGVEIVVLGAGTQRPKASVAPLADLEGVLEFDLDVDRFPFLRSHVMDGHAVLPMAMYVEWFAHAALHHHPGMRFLGANDLRVLKGVILNASSARLRILAGKPRGEEQTLVIPVELRSVTDGQETIHARGEIVLGTEYSRAVPRLAVPADAGAYSDGVYSTGRLFHGESFHGIDSVDAYWAEGLALSAHSAPAPSQWIVEPLRGAWISDPLILDCGFQAMIVWSFERYGMGCLPSFFGRFRQFRSRFPRGDVKIVVVVTKEGPHRAVVAIEYLDALTGELVARMDECECVLDRSLNSAFQRNQLIAQA